MFKKAAILDQPRPQHKRPLDHVQGRPCELSDQEVFRLMQAFTRDKTMILEEDAMTLCRWAQAQKFGAYVLELVLQGDLVPHVHNGEVRVSLPGRPQEEEHSHAP